jgi:fatty-acyl-CoA synthase
VDVDQLHHDAHRVARAMLERFRPGEHVAVWASNCPEWVLLEMGAAYAGLTLVTVNPAYQVGELAHVLGQSRCQGTFVQDTYRGRDLLAITEDARPGLPALRDVIALSGWDGFLASGDGHRELPSVEPGDIAQIQYTSGTTGAPKGAQLTHRGLVNVGRYYAVVNGARAEDIWVNPMPMFHTAGCGLLTLGALQTGGTHVLPPGFDPAVMLDAFAAERGTSMLSVPTILIRMLDEQSVRPRDLSSWRLSTLGGAPVPPELVRRARTSTSWSPSGSARPRRRRTSPTRCPTTRTRTGSPRWAARCPTARSASAIRGVARRWRSAPSVGCVRADTGS